MKQAENYVLRLTEKKTNESRILEIRTEEYNDIFTIVSAFYNSYLVEIYDKATFDYENKKNPSLC